MIKLNAIELDKDLVWVDEFDTPAIVQGVQCTYLGGLVIQKGGVIKGRLITLAAVSSGNAYTGSFTRTQILAFKELEAAGSEVTFEYGDEVLTVLVSAGGVQVAPLIPRPNQELTDLYTGTLILIEV